MIFFPATPGSANSLCMAIGGILCVSLLLVVMGWCASNLPIKLIRPRLLQGNCVYDVNKPHPQSWIFASLCWVSAVCLIGAAVSLLISAFTKYDTMSFAKESRVLTVHFLLAPDQEFKLDQLSAISVEQKSYPEKWLSVFGPKFGCRIGIVKKDGGRVTLNSLAYWHSQLHPKNEKEILARFPSRSAADLENHLSEERISLGKLQTFLGELKASGLPIRFTYDDGSGQSQPTESFINAPGVL